LLAWHRTHGKGEGEVERRIWREAKEVVV